MGSERKSRERLTKAACRHPDRQRHQIDDCIQWCADCGALRYEHGWSGYGPTGREKSLGKWLKPTGWRLAIFNNAPGKVKHG